MRLWQSARSVNGRTIPPAQQSQFGLEMFQGPRQLSGMFDLYPELA